MLKRSVVAIFLCSLLAFWLTGCGGSGSNPGDTSADITPTPTIASTTASSPTASLTPVPPHVTGIAMGVTPGSFGSVGCGSAINIVFSAAITVGAGSTGGQIPFTWNIDHTSIQGNVTFAPGQTTKTVTYTLSNYAVQLSSTSAVSGSISVGDSGSAVNSATVGPTGTCKLPGPFQVTGISLSVSPASLASIACNSTITVTYTATVYIAADSNAGTVQLNWTVGGGNQAASIVFAPTQTVGSVSISQTGKVTKTSPFPHTASIASTVPNAVTSAMVKPAGVCA
jgi:hypothetical protein